MRVDANYRFIASYQEVNARVAQRQQALGLSVSLVVSLLAAGGLAVGWGAGFSIYPERVLGATWLLAVGAALGLLALALLAWTPRLHYRSGA